MSLRISGTKGTPRAAAHFDRLIETPVPYRCSTATKIRPVAAAINVTISHSSKWLSARLSPLNKPIPLASALNRPRARALPIYLLIVGAAGRASVHLDVELLGDKVEHLLPDAALGPCIGRTHCRLPGLDLIVGQIVQRGLAGLLDLSQRILVFLDRDRVGVIGRLVQRIVKLLADVGRQSVPELRVDDDRALQVSVVGDRDVLLHLVKLLCQII